MIRLVCAWVLVNGTLLAPVWVRAALAGGPWAPWISVEAALIVGGIALLPRARSTRAVVWVVSVGVVLAALVVFGDLVFRESLGRPLNLSLDLYLLDAVRRLAVGNLGTGRTLVLGLALGAVSVGLVGAAVRLLGPVAAEGSERTGDAGGSRDAGDAQAVGPVRTAAKAVAATGAALGLLGLVVPWVGARVDAPVASLAVEQAWLWRETRAERAAFEAALADDPVGTAALDGIAEPFDRLGGSHVVIAYVESYGMAALEDPDFAAFIRPRLEEAASKLEAAGVHVVTGELTSPTVGGQSWYAHGTMLSGLWLDDQLRYELSLASDRATLVDDFHRAGYGTATVMPAITTPWPEAFAMGFDRVFTAENIPYQGPPFYWVTMPDQFTWSFLAGVLRLTADPLFVEVGMVSSHAPWTPVLPLVDWDAMDDGRVFEPYRVEGTPPDESWWDVDVLRDGYARSLAYSVEAMAEFAERLLDDRTLLIVPGDHQAAPWVTGADDADVPVHVLARDPALLEPFRAWGFRRGTLPDPGATPHRMDDFRAWFVQAYSTGR